MNTEYPGYLVDHAGIQMYLKEMFWEGEGTSFIQIHEILNPRGSSLSLDCTDSSRLRLFPFSCTLWYQCY